MVAMSVSRNRCFDDQGSGGHLIGPAKARRRRRGRLKQQTQDETDNDENAAHAYAIPQYRERLKTEERIAVKL